MNIRIAVAVVGCTLVAVHGFTCWRIKRCAQKKIARLIPTVKEGGFQALDTFESVRAIAHKHRVPIPGGYTLDEVAQIAYTSYEKAVDRWPASLEEKEPFYQKLRLFK